jgi:hypothetical protein
MTTGCHNVNHNHEFIRGSGEQLFASLSEVHLPILARQLPQWPMGEPPQPQISVLCCLASIGASCRAAVADEHSPSNQLADMFPQSDASRHKTSHSPFTSSGPQLQHPTSASGHRTDGEAGFLPSSPPLLSVAGSAPQSARQRPLRRWLLARRVGARRPHSGPQKLEAGCPSPPRPPDGKESSREACALGAGSSSSSNVSGRLGRLGSLTGLQNGPKGLPAAAAGPGFRKAHAPGARKSRACRQLGRGSDQQLQLRVQQSQRAQWRSSTVKLQLRPVLRAGSGMLTLKGVWATGLPTSALLCIWSTKDDSSRNVSAGGAVACFFGSAAC